ncbi:MAG: long-chain fatty acid--CoA ligase [Rhizobiaceae bacterium]|nr:MAG: long-chain fatty acid--CoA ligase [Rhizobiaceae bacterium]CAG0984369.1 long-chain acyl-CoA synthetase [Rhizobiaceae bacterium]
MNLYSMLADAIRRRPGEAAIVHGRRSLTYAAFDRAAAAVGDHYCSLGCGRGDRVLLFLKNGFEYPVLLLAAIRAGMVVVPVNAKLHPREVAWIAGDAAPKVIVTHGEYVAAIEEALPDGVAPTMVAIEDFVLPVDAGDAPPPKDAVPDDPAWIFYTSGTTGKPKGATLTHRNLIAATVNCLADIFPFHATDRVLHVAPLSHGSGLYFIPSLVRGAENIIWDRQSFQPDEVLDAVAARGITVFAFVAPTMIVRMLDARPRDDIGSLRGVIYGGATIHLEHLKAAVKRFGPIFHQLYGQGEAPMTISYLPGADHADADDETLLSAGYVRAGVEVRLVDETGRPVPPGADGEICVRGDVVMKGYWGNPAATATAIRDGWLHTGDIGHFDSGGRLRVLDRRHDTIISGGTNIYPKEVEDVIAAHPAVREVISFGLPDDEWGESVAVAIVADPAQVPTAADILAFCRESLASFKKPKHVFFVDELPKSAYGKVLRRTLREQFAPQKG